MSVKFVSSISIFELSITIFVPQFWLTGPIESMPVPYSILPINQQFFVCNYFMTHSIQLSLTPTQILEACIFQLSHSCLYLWLLTPRIYWLNFLIVIPFILLNHCLQSSSSRSLFSCISSLFSIICLHIHLSLCSCLNIIVPDILLAP